MRRLAPLTVLLLVAACGGSGAAQGELSAATFLVEVGADDVEIVGRDRLVNSGTEDRLDVLRPGGDMTIVPIHPNTPVPEPFEFVRDPLSAGSIVPLLDDAERVIAVINPLIDRTPGGRVLAGSIITFGPGGNLLHADWDDDDRTRLADLLAWGAERGLDSLATIELAVRGLGGDDGSEAQTAASYFE
ncbi:MAG: hypothetical protein WD990_13920 [Acidimicrobiia bacterium]